MIWWYYTDKAVVTLPYESYIQFINTKSLTLDKTIQVGQSWFGITTSENYIAVGKAKEIKILKQNGEIIKTIIVLIYLLFSEVCSLLYNHQDGRIIFRKKERVGSIKYFWLGTNIHLQMNLIFIKKTGFNMAIQVLL